MGDDEDIIFEEVIRRHKETGYPIGEIFQSAYMLKFRRDILKERSQRMAYDYMRKLQNENS